MYIMSVGTAIKGCMKKSLTKANAQEISIEYTLNEEERRKRTRDNSHKNRNMADTENTKKNKANKHVRIYYV